MTTILLLSPREQVFKLGLWSALVFFEHGSEMQLAAALVINVLQLCVHIEIKPMGGEDAALLNLMQTCTLVLTTYINFGALSMNYLKVSQTLAHFVDPGNVDEYDASIAAIGILMQLLTFGLFLSFGGVAIKAAVMKARGTSLSELRGRIASAVSRGRTRDDSNAPSSPATTSDQSDPPATSAVSLVLSSIRRGVMGIYMLPNPMSAGSSKGEAKADQAELGGIELSASQQTGAAPKPQTRALSSNTGETMALPAPKHSAPFTAVPTNTAPLPLGWRSATSPKGVSYFYHEESGETVWSRPF